MLKKRQFIPEAVFLKLRNQMSELSLCQEMGDQPDAGRAERDFTHKKRMARNAIDRLTGTTPDEGGLFFSDAREPVEGLRTQLFINTSAASMDLLRELFEFIGDNGFGANASVGHGAMNFHILEESSLFDFPGNRAMTLSHGVLTSNQRNPRYRNHSHFGKLGGHFANTGFSPFKYPILMVRPGSTFEPTDEGPFGEILSGVHHDPQLSTIRHHAMHLPVFFNEVVS